MMYVLQRLLSLLYLILWSGFYLDEVLFCFIALLFHLVAMKEEKSNKCFNTIIILSITFGFCSKCKQVHNCDRCQLWYQFMFGLHYYSCNNIKHERPLAISNYLILKPQPRFTFYSDFQAVVLCVCLPLLPCLKNSFYFTTKYKKIFFQDRFFKTFDALFSSNQSFPFS